MSAAKGKLTGRFEAELSRVRHFASEENDP
jgi:hypothetical protein